MRQLNITFEDEEYKELLKKKNGLTWHNFIMLLLNIPDEKIRK